MPSALQKFLFGEGTPDTYESLQSKRAMAERYAASLSQTPQNLGQGLSALGRAYASRKLMDQANTGDAKGKADFGSAFARIMAGRNVPAVVTQAPTVAEPTPRNVDAQDPRTGEAMYAGTSGANTSKDAELIKSFEGYRDTPYYDVNAYRAGYGSDTTTDQFGNVTPISQGSRVDTESANRDLNRRIVTEFRPKAAKAAGDMWNNLSDSQRASLTSIAYNYGDIPGSVKSALSSGDVGTVSRAIAGLASHNDGINASRRATEASIFSGGDIPQTYQVGLGSTNQGPSVQELVGAMGNPYATPAQKMALGTMLQQKLAANQPMSPQDQLDMEYRKAQIEALKAKQAAAGNQSTEYGLTPQYGVDENNNPVLIQIGKDGTAVRTPLPDGVSLSKQPIKMDAGTHFVLLDPITRQPVGTIPKDNRGEASEKAVGTATGKAQGEAIVNLGSAIAGAESAIKVIDEIYNDPNLESVTGMIQGSLPPLTQGGTDLVAKIDQAKGKVFMEAYTTLKGGGQITEVEGKKAEQAIARLNRAQSVEAYKAALDDLKDVINKGLARAKEKAGVVSAPPPAQPAIIPSTAPQPSDQSDPLGLFN